MRYKEFEFEWDNENSHKIKQRFSLEDVEAVFNQELLEFPDSSHSHCEDRIIGIGKGPGGKAMYICFTIRNNKIRVISARFMREKEVEKDETFKKNEEE